jgi:hypothetical protein
LLNLEALLEKKGLKELDGWQKASKLIKMAQIRKQKA